MSGRLLTTREVAGQIGVSVETVLRWVKHNAMPAIRLPSGQLRFRQKDLDNWLAERATAYLRAEALGRR